jgi:AcrR family transcriptional regulator
MVASMPGTTRGEVTPRTPRPRREEVRTRILAAAAAVVADRGLAAASLDQVAAAAGFTKGAVYSNFASKDELFLALVEEATSRRVKQVTAALAGASDLDGALAAVSAALAAPDRSVQLLFVEFWQRAVRDPDVRAAFVASRRELREQIADVIAGFLAERGIATSWDPGSLAVVITALANGLALEAVPDPGVVPEGLAARVLTALVEPPGSTA